MRSTIAATPFPRLVESAAISPSSFRNPADVAKISAAGRPEYTRSTSATNPDTIAASEAPAKYSRSPSAASASQTWLCHPFT